MQRVLRLGLIVLVLLVGLVSGASAQSDKPVAELTAQERAAEQAYVRKALQSLEDRGQDFPGDLTEAYGYIHERAWRLGDGETAHAATTHMVSGWEQLYGAESTDLADRLDTLASRLKALGDPAAARPLYERSLAIREVALGSEHPDVAVSLHNLATLLHDLGDHAAARALYERALAIHVAALGPDHLNVAATLNNLANLLQDRGDFDEARRLHERALAIRETALGSEHPDVALSLNNLAVLRHDLGDGVGARPLYERSLAIREATLGPGHPDVANSLNNLANLLKDLGDLAGARPLLERALAMREAAYGPEHPEVADNLNDLAIVLAELGDVAAAQPLFEHSLAIQAAVLGPEHPDVALRLTNLAILLAERGDPVAARPLFERALAIREVALGPEHPDVAYSLDNLAALLHGLGDLAGARPLYERSLAIREAALGPDHPDVAHSLASLARLWLDAADAQAADGYARRLVASRGQVQRTLATLTEGEGISYLARLRGQRDTVLSVAASRDDQELAYASVLDAKGQLARITLRSRDQLRAALTPAVLAQTVRLQQLQTRLSRLALRTDIPDAEAHESLLESLRAERDGLERDLRRRADVEEGATTTVQDVVHALPPGSVAVDLLVHPVYRPATVQDGQVVVPGGFSEPRVSAWITRSGTDGVQHVDLGSAAVIETAVGAFLEDLVLRRGASLAKSESTPDVNADLRALVWDPLSPHLHGVETVFVSPDGVLCTLPFETLRDEDGRYLLEQHAFVYPTDVASMVRRPRDVDRLGDRPGSLLAVGGVDFGQRAALVMPGTPAGGDDLRGGFETYWGRLPATEYESQVVWDMHADAFGDDASRLLLQGADATEERLKAEMPRHATLHIATHGFFQPEGLPSMWEAALDAVSGEHGSQLTNSAARLTGLHPGLLSGLVLAGANRPPVDDATDTDAAVRDDGYLTASEVTLLDLEGVGLVVLSACETGLGRPQSGEGLLGLRRAFHMAGAETVISSLWSVKDESTSELMQAFYRNLFLRGMDRHEALRAAQLELLQRNRAEHGAGLPSTWGAFVLSGEWR